MWAANHDAPRSVYDVDSRLVSPGPDAGGKDYPELKQVAKGSIRRGHGLYRPLTMPNVFIYDFSYWNRSFMAN
jgi:hypothetical protein